MRINADQYLHKPVAGKKILDAIDDLFSEPTQSDWQKMAAGMVTPVRTSIGKAKKAATSLPKKRGK